MITQILEKTRDVSTITGLVKLYFRLMPEPIIPFELYGPVIASSAGPDELRYIMIRNSLSLLPSENTTILKLLSFHLNRVSGFYFLLTHFFRFLNIQK
mgnify:CR=1 FL=1